jgi:uncharacterized membrane protein YhaH (DUF805 family)
MFWYRILTIVLLASIVAAIALLSLDKIQAGIICAIVALVIIITQISIVKCRHCGARPGLWILAVWTLLMDFDLYLADVIMLRECPRCNKPLGD